MVSRVLNIRTQQREILARIMSAHEKVQQRLQRVTRSLEEAGVRFAVVGGNAVAVWVATRDESLVRATRDLDLLIDRVDLDRVKASLEGAGFVFRHVAGMDVFLDGPDSKVGDAVHVLYAGEKVLPGHVLPAPNLEEADRGPDFRVLSLEGLVQMKLDSWRRKDQVHLLDLIGAGLVDDSWPLRYAEPLRSRLLELIDNPE